METLIHIREAIENAWSFQTSYCDDLFDWQLSNEKATGQCAVTSVLLQEIFGGILMKGMVNGKPHYWNCIDGIDVDLTWRQFTTGARVTDIRYQVSREELIKNSWMQQRYENLKAAYDNYKLKEKDRKPEH